MGEFPLFCIYFHQEGGCVKRTQLSRTSTFIISVLPYLKGKLEVHSEET